MNKTNNGAGGRAGKGVPHLSTTKLLKYGITPEQQIAARLAGLKWCGWHKRFENPQNFDKGCKLCRAGAKIRNLELYTKNGNARKYHKKAGWYGEKFEEQGLHCALCPATVCSRDKNRLCIDHNHLCCSTTKGCCGKCVRGLLCTACNQRMGHFEVTVAEATVIPIPGTWTEKALAYLKSYEKDSVAA
jgi:hypothetical protein